MPNIYIYRHQFAGLRKTVDKNPFLLYHHIIKPI